MKRLIIDVVLPITILSFCFVSKWWDVHVVDWDDTCMIGFPLPYRAPGFHTSLSTQYFLFEMIFDFCVYFLFWFAVIFFIDRFAFLLTVPKKISLTSRVLIVIFAAIYVYVCFGVCDIVKWKNDLGIVVKSSGYAIGWSVSSFACR